MTKPILVIGATGKQGGAVIRAILDSNEAAGFTLLGLTRNATSTASQNLIKRDVKAVQGDLNDVPAVFAKAKEVAGGPIWGVFCMLVIHSNSILKDI